MYVLLGLLLFIQSTFYTAAGKDIIVLYFASASDTNGTVKARVNGSPGAGEPDKTICWDGNWGMEEAHVVCKQMGFLNAANHTAVVITNNPILFGVSCKGTEKNLTGCSYQLTGTCTGSRGVSVTCIPNTAFADLFDARLTGTAAHKGIVEVRRTFQAVGINRPWFASCYDYWSVEDSQVICRQLGYSGVKATQGFSGNHFNVDDAEFKCSGTELTLRGCNTNPNPSACTNKTTFPEVECKLDSGTQQPFDVRLTHGGSPSSGTVEVKKYGRWGFICGSTWNQESAMVVCQQLGFVDVISIKKDSTFGQSGLPMFLRQPECKAGNWSIRECPGTYYGWGGGSKTCASKNTAGVVCNPTKFPSYDIGATPLTPNATESSGRFFLQSPGFPQTFTYPADTHLVCTMKTDNTIDFSLYIHYKMFQQNHQETLSFQAADNQVSGSGNFYSLNLYGDDSNPGPYTTKSKSLVMEFKANGATGKGKIRVEVRVSSGTAVALTCMKPTTTAPPNVATTTRATTAGTTASTALDVTSTGNHPTTVVNTTTVAMTASTTPSSPTVGIHETSSLTTDGTNYTQTAHAPAGQIYIPIVATLVPLLVIIVVIIVVVVILTRRRKANKAAGSINATAEPDPDDSGIFEMDPNAKRKRKSTKSGHDNAAFNDVNIKPMGLYHDVDLESPLKGGVSSNPQLNLYELEAPPGKVEERSVDPELGDANHTYTAVNKLRKKPKPEVKDAVDNEHTYGVVNKPKKRTEDGGNGQEGGGDANPPGPEYAEAEDGAQWEGNQPAEQQYAEVNEPREGEQMDETQPEFAMYAEVDYNRAPTVGSGARPKDPGKTGDKAKSDKKKAKKSEKSDKKSKLNPFARNKKSKGSKTAGAMAPPRPRSHAYDDIDTDFQARDRSQTHTGASQAACSPYADVDLASLPNSGGSRDRAAPAPSDDDPENVYNRLNFPMLKKGASSFGDRPRDQTYDAVKLDKYHDVQLENPYDGYGKEAAVDIDNPYSEAAPVSNINGGGDLDLYDQALPVAVEGTVAWDDGPEQIL